MYRLPLSSSRSCFFLIIWEDPGPQGWLDGETARAEPRLVATKLALDLT